MYEEACEAGSSAAAFFLGHRLHAGDEELGIEADGARALQLLRRSSEQVRILTAVFVHVGICIKHAMLLRLSSRFPWLQSLHFLYVRIFAATVEPSRLLCCKGRRLLRPSTVW